MHYLIPVDGKPHTQESIALALRVFDLPGNEVTLLHIVDPGSQAGVLPDGTGSPEKSLKESSREEAEKLLQALSHPLSLLGCTVHNKVEEGLAAGAITACAQKEKYSVTIVCPGAHTAEELMLNGSVTAQLLQFGFPGTLVKARDLSNVAQELWAVFLLEHGQDAYIIKELAPALAKELKILVVTADPTAMLIPMPGSTDSSAEAAFHAERIAGVKQAAEAEFASIGRAYEQMTLKTRFKDWLISFLRSNDIGILLIPQRKESPENRSAFGTAEEEIFLKAPCPTALCRQPASAS